MAQIKEERVSSVPLTVDQMLKTSTGFEPWQCYRSETSAVSDRVQVAAASSSIGY